jgi:DNA polymerase IV
MTFPLPGQITGLSVAGPRKIVHVDMDAFYASVEIRDDPALKGRPVAVAHYSRRGVVLTANYEARVYGVRSAMPTQMALARCPGLVLVPPRMEVYSQVSGVVRAVFFQFTDLVEPLSLDEAYLDVSEPKQGPRSGTLIARAVKQSIWDATGLTASAGVSHTKFLAKIASDMNKPDGLTVILPEDAQALIGALPITAFHGVGPATAARMREHGIETGADLRSQRLGDLRAWFGAHGEHYHRISHGIDERPVEPNRALKSVGAERTFETDLRGVEAVCAVLERLAQALCVRLARSGYSGRTLVLKLKFADHSVLTRRVSQDLPLQDAGRIRALAELLVTPELLQNRRVRLVGLSVSGTVGSKTLSAGEPLQPRLFPGDGEG